MQQIPSEKIWKGFREHFGTDNIFIHDILTNLSGKYELDIAKFEKWLIAQGYKIDKPGSMADFIQEKYGKEALTFIRKLV